MRVAYPLHAWRTLRANEAFRRAPLRTLARCVAWVGHVAARREATAAFPRLGVTLTLPPRMRSSGASSLYVLRDDCDPDVNRMANRLREGMVVIDGGANLGLYMSVAAGRVGSSGRVLAFEPGSETFRYLARNAAGFDNTTAYQAALSDTSGERRLYHIDDAPNSYSFAANGNEYETVRTMTLDELGLSRLDFLKLDVEGAEELVLRGGREVIQGGRPVVLFEMNPRRAADLGCRPEGAWELLRGLGYRLERELTRGNNLALP